ncbi:MAG: hydrolase [Planctomycetota bacterium]
MENIYDAETGCCPQFNPIPWDEKEHVWDNKRFIKDSVRAIFHIPLGFGKVIQKNMKKIQTAEAFTVEPPVCLCDETCAWKIILYIETTKDLSDAEMVTISGSFLSKVFEGPYKEAPKWYKQMTEFVRSRGKEAQKTYAYYTTCPKCAKEYGKNYVVLISRV